MTDPKEYQPGDLRVGDELTVQGICVGGRLGEATPDHPLLRWRVTALSAKGINLVPLDASGQPDYALAAWLAVNGFLPPTPAMLVKAE